MSHISVCSICSRSLLEQKEAQQPWGYLECSCEIPQQHTAHLPELCCSLCSLLGVCYLFPGNEENCVFPSDFCTSCVISLCVSPRLPLSDKLLTPWPALHKMSLSKKNSWPGLTALRCMGILLQKVEYKAKHNTHQSQNG